MAKNTSSTAFRKIDVDQYNEDNFKVDETMESLTPSSFPDEAEIISLISLYPSFILFNKIRTFVVVVY